MTQDSENCQHLVLMVTSVLPLCALLCVHIDHTVVVVQLDVRCRKGSNCYPLSVDLLEYTGNQIKTLETSVVNLRIQ